MQITKEITIQETTTKEQTDFADNIKEWLINKGYVREEANRCSYAKGLITIQPSMGGFLISISESFLLDGEGKTTNMRGEKNFPFLLAILQDEAAKGIDDMAQLYSFIFGGEK